MRALTVQPGSRDSARLDDQPRPAAELATVPIAPLAVGVCGTDVEILSGDYGWPPPGLNRAIVLENDVIAA